MSKNKELEKIKKLYNNLKKKIEESEKKIVKSVSKKSVKKKAVKRRSVKLDRKKALKVKSSKPRLIKSEVVKYELIADSPLPLKSKNKSAIKPKLTIKSFLSGKKNNKPKLTNRSNLKFSSSIIKKIKIDEDNKKKGSMNSIKRLFSENPNKKSKSKSIVLDSNNNITIEKN